MCGGEEMVERWVVREEVVCEEVVCEEVVVEVVVAVVVEVVVVTHDTCRSPRGWRTCPSRSRQ